MLVSVLFCLLLFSFVFNISSVLVFAFDLEFNELGNSGDFDPIEELNNFLASLVSENNWISGFAQFKPDSNLGTGLDLCGCICSLCVCVCVVCTYINKLTVYCLYVYVYVFLYKYMHSQISKKGNAERFRIRIRVTFSFEFLFSVLIVFVVCRFSAFSSFRYIQVFEVVVVVRFEEEANRLGDSKSKWTLCGQEGSIGNEGTKVGGYTATWLNILKILYI